MNSTDIKNSLEPPGKAILTANKRRVHRHWESQPCKQSHEHSHFRALSAVTRSRASILREDQSNTPINLSRALQSYQNAIHSYNSNDNPFWRCETLYHLQPLSKHTAANLDPPETLLRLRHLTFKTYQCRWPTAWNPTRKIMVLPYCQQPRTHRIPSTGPPNLPQSHRRRPRSKMAKRGTL